MTAIALREILLIDQAMTLVRNYRGRLASPWFALRVATVHEDRLFQQQIMGEFYNANLGRSYDAIPRPARNRDTQRGNAQSRADGFTLLERERDSADL